MFPARPPAQVIAVLASTRTAWPPSVAVLLRLLSAFNLNVELLEPECLVAGATLEQKYIVTLLLPVVLAALLLVVHAGSVGLKFALGRSKQLQRNLPMLVSVLLVLSSFLYLDVTLMLLQLLGAAERKLEAHRARVHDEQQRRRSTACPRTRPTGGRTSSPTGSRAALRAARSRRCCRGPWRACSCTRLATHWRWAARGGATAS
jgi:hypothetical protein